MKPVAAPADKRFRRSRVSPGKKRGWRPSWPNVVRVLGLALALGLGLYATVSCALASDALRVMRISVAGNHRMSKGEVLALLDGLAGTSLVTTDLDTWRVKLLSSPWVQDATLRRMFPGTLAVVVTERTPVGVGRVKGALYLVDDTGAIIDEFGPNYADLDLPIIDGLHGEGGDEGAVDQTRASFAGRVMSELRPWPRLAARVSQIDVSDPQDAVVILKGDTALVRLGHERFSERLRSYLDLMPALREQVPDIDYVDLRFDERVYVRPQRARPATARAAQRGG